MTPSLKVTVRAIYAFYAQGDCTLQGAAQMAQGSSSKHVNNWPGALAAFRKQRLEIEGRTSEKTWRMKYAPVLEAAVGLMSTPKAPACSADLCDQILVRWEPGSRQRQIMRQNLHAFLRYCVEREHFKTC